MFRSLLFDHLQGSSSVLSAVTAFLLVLLLQVVYLVCGCMLSMCVCAWCVAVCCLCVCVPDQKSSNSTKHGRRPLKKVKQ
jgi:hypothetical protein